MQGFQKWNKMDDILWTYLQELQFGEILEILHRWLQVLFEIRWLCKGERGDNGKKSTTSCLYKSWWYCQWSYEYGIENFGWRKNFIIKNQWFLKAAIYLKDRWNWFKFIWSNFCTNRIWSTLECRNVFS